MAHPAASSTYYTNTDSSTEPAMPAPKTETLSEAAAGRLLTRIHSDDSLYRGYRSSLASPPLPPSPIFDNRRWCIYEHHPNDLLRSLQLSDEACSSGGGSDQHFHVKPSFVPLEDSQHASMPSQRNNSVRSKADPPLNREINDDNDGAAIGSGESSMEDMKRQAREEALRLLTSREQEAEEKKLQSTAAGLFEADQQSEKAVEVIDEDKAAERKNRRQGETEFNGRLVSYIRIP